MAQSGVVHEGWRCRAEQKRIRLDEEATTETVQYMAFGRLAKATTGLRRDLSSPKQNCFGTEHSRIRKSYFQGYLNTDRQ
jgi:hypothetical protein